jgi:hypothetical protein
MHAMVPMARWAEQQDGDDEQPHGRSSSLVSSPRKPLMFETLLAGLR